jgi:transposase-like protein
VAGREGREVWAKRVARWRESGLTAKEFAADMGVNAHTLSHWAWQLGAAGDQAADRHRRTTTKRPAPAKWVEVISRDHGNGGSPPAAAASARSSSFELVLAGGRRLRVPPDFDSEALGRLLTVVDAR